MTDTKKTTRGFTLIEVLMVIVILGMLATVAIVSLSGTREKAKIDTTRQLISSVESALGIYATHIGQYPTEDQGLKALRERPDFDVGDGGSDPSKQWAGPYLQTTPKDAWGNELVYQPVEADQLVADDSGRVPKAYKLFSKGPDGQEDSEDDISTDMGDEEDA